MKEIINAIDYKTEIPNEYKNYLETSSICYGYNTIEEFKNSKDYGDWLKLSFMTEYLFDICTDDDDLSYEFGKVIIEIIKVIKERNTFEYMKASDENYKNMILVMNLIDSWLECGSSIRGSWFDTYDGVFHVDCGNMIGNIKITDEFIDWFIEYFDVD